MGSAVTACRCWDPKCALSENQPSCCVISNICRKNVNAKVMLRSATTCQDSKRKNLLFLNLIFANDYFKFFFISDHLGRGRWCLKIVFLFPLCHSLQYLTKVLVTQSCPTLCDPTDCSPPGSSVHGLFQARILEWVSMPFPKGSSWPRSWTLVSCIVGRFFTVWTTREVQHLINTSNS